MSLFRVVLNLATLGLSDLVPYETDEERYEKALRLIVSGSSDAVKVAQEALGEASGDGHGKNQTN